MKPRRRRLGQRVAHATPALLALLVLAALVLGAFKPELWERSVNLSYDVAHGLIPRSYVPVPVRIVDIDEASLAELGQWPWPRTRIAELIERLRAAGAASIAFDIAFTEPDRTSPAQAAKDWLPVPGLAPILAELPDHDRLFAASIAKGRVVTGFILGAASELSRVPLLKAGIAFRGGLPPLERFAAALSTLAPLESAAAGNGALNFVPSDDGVIRRVPLLLRLGDTAYPSLAAEALRVREGVTNIVAAVADEARLGVERLDIGRLHVPTDAEANVWLHFTRAAPQRTLSARAVFAGDARLAEVKDAVVLIGTSAPGLLDLRFGPFGVLPGVEVHAQAVETAMLGAGLSRPPWAFYAELCFMVLGSLLVLALAMASGAMWSAIAGAALVMAALGGALWLFAAGLIFAPVYPALGIVAVFLAASVPRHLLAEREGQWVRRAFASYVSPNLVRHLIEHPEMLQLGGDRRECSFVLTDLAGFTGLVERSDPAELVALLNEYLDGMVQIAFRHEGTLDKVVGDAIAVMFSAPVVQPDHAARAVACALAMDEFAQRFSAERNAEGVPLGVTRIGVNTGPVIVGNVGGETMDYRPLGDAINTASRLETVNKQLGTRICISDATASRVPGFVGRPVGRLLLKGKSEEILCWEPIAPGEATDRRIAAYRAAYDLMDSEYPGAAAAFELLAQEWPDDPLIAFHHARLSFGDTGATVAFQEK